MLSIVTATYNRDFLLSRLYETLIKQTCLDFEWIVVDDGSTDNTKVLLNKWILQKKINIKFFDKENGGKHTALNMAFKKSCGDFILIVDSDDLLSINAVEIIKSKIIEIKKNKFYERLSGICFPKADLNGILIGNTYIHSPFLCNYLDYRYKYKIAGDKTEIFKRDVLLEFPFPEFKNEKFCPEALIWNRIAKKYDMVFYNDIIYLCEYQVDGLTSKIYEMRKRSPKATLQYYYELSLLNLPILIKFKAILNYWRFYFISENVHNNINMPKGFLANLGKLFIYCLYFFKII
ncbi:glycosyltransferase family 2 protein [Acinetobacter towneri]|uniref:glycosyltransferase family 2 protein n=1 Tax=Acinetobacter towneri TaxID=202956 RepID=UPI003A84CD14